MKIKMYCVVLRSVAERMKNEAAGKAWAQAGHAFLHAFWDAEKRFPEMAQAYRDSDHSFKITLVVDTEEELNAIRDECYPLCGVSLVKDSGFTVFEVPTVTCLGIGPIGDSVPEILSRLKTYRK